MTVLQSADNLLKEEEGLVGRKGAAADKEVEELDTVDELHDQKVVSVIIVNVDERQEVRMRQYLENSNLAAHLHLQGWLLLEELPANNLNRHNLTSVRVLCKPHL